MIECNYIREGGLQLRSNINSCILKSLFWVSRGCFRSQFKVQKKSPIVDHHIFQVLVAILPKRDICGFDLQSKTWRNLSSMQQLTEVVGCSCAECIGNCLYVARRGDVVCFDIVHNIWSTLPAIPGLLYAQIDSLCHIEDHIYVVNNSSEPYRYNIATNQWQSIASPKIIVSDLSQNKFCNKAVTVYKSCLYVLYAQGIKEYENRACISRPYNSLLYCFDPKKNVWEQKASTKTPHFGSILLVVNNNLYVAGGNCSFCTASYEPSGRSAAIEVYSDQENAWSVVKQTHFPTNNLGAVGIDGRVYFIINSFPIDSGITIPPAGEVYPVVLDEWCKLGRVDKNAVLCYVPVNKQPNPENLKTK